MSKLIHILGATSLLISSHVVVAGTIIEIKNNNEIFTVMTDGKQARMNTGASDYVIVDYKTNSMKNVNRNNRQVMLFDIDNMTKTGNVPRVQLSIKNLGAGSSIAGYKTQKFGYAVNGKTCGIVYGSKDAYQHKGVNALFDTIKTMMQKQLAMLGGFASMVDDCTLADVEISNHVATIGAPMRIEKKGSVDIEVKSIKLDVPLPANTFVIPVSYKIVSINGESQKLQKDMTKMQRQISQNQQPKMQQMMQQMQQSGQMPPEVMERMRRAQEQMKRYPRQGY